MSFSLLGHAKGSRPPPRLLLLAALLFSPSCHWRARQVMLRVSSDIPLAACAPGGRLTALGLVVTNDASSCTNNVRSQSRLDLTRTSLPLSVAIQQDPGTLFAQLPGDPNRPLHVCLTAYGPGPATAAPVLLTREAVVRFPSSAEEVLDLRIHLSSACVGNTTCDPAAGNTCGDTGLCAPRELTTNSLPRFDAANPVPLPGAVCDALTDAGPDAPSDAATADAATVDATDGAPADVNCNAMDGGVVDCRCAPSTCGVGNECRSDGYCYPRAQALGMSNTATCVVTGSGAELRCAGGNQWGQLGRDAPAMGGSDSGASPTNEAGATRLDASVLPAGPFTVREVRGSSGTVALTSLQGSETFCAILDSASGARVVCWGLPFEVTTVPSTGRAVALPPTLPVLSLAMGGRHACAVVGAGDTYCWGSNPYALAGRCSDTSAVSADSPARVLLPPAWGRPLQVAAGTGFTCVRTREGRVGCWGRRFQTAPDAAPDCADPDVVPATELATHGVALELTASGQTACMLNAAGDAYCWGVNSTGALGTNDTNNRDTPGLVAGGHSWQRISAGQSNTCALDSSGRLYCWGSNAFAALPAADGGLYSVDQRVPVATSLQANPLDRDVALQVGRGGTCLRTSARSMTCFGRNNAGQLWFNPSSASAGAGEPPTVVPLP